MKQLTAVTKQVEAIAALWGVNPTYLPTFGWDEGNARPSIFFHPHTQQYEYRLSERGQCIQQRFTSEADELLFWIAAAITHQLACNYEVRHRQAGQDSRRLLFAHQLALLQQVDPVMAAVREREIEAILQKFPYLAMPQEKSA
ncbi:MAG: Imm63 family immunity protein [Chloroflexi bacterium]|nr:Imm63 family immunity protein [Chloroflexota bacterium]